MKTGILLAGVAVLVVAAQAAQAAPIVSPANAPDGQSSGPMQASNTVKSGELITDFSVVKDASEADVVGTVNLFRVGQGERGPTLLQISADDVITLSVQDKSVICFQNKECRLPYIKGETYRSELKRGNGEVFKNETTLPPETKILAPAENTLVNKDDAVHFSWEVARADGPRGISLSVFLGEQIKTCGTTGFISWDTEGTATAPAKYVSTCKAPLRARFNVFYVNPAKATGVAGGTLKGYSTARVSFSYVEPSISFDLDPSPLTLEDIRELNEAAASGQRATQTLRR